MKVPDHWWDPADVNGICGGSGEGPLLGINKGRLLHIAHPDAFNGGHSLCHTTLRGWVSSYTEGRPFRLCEACYKLYTTGGE